MSETEAIAGTATDKGRAHDWVLVLTSAGIDHRVQAEPGRWTIVVAGDDLERARAALEAYEAENPELPARPGEAAEYGPTSAGLLIALALLAIYFVTHVYDPHGQWYWRGNASATRILEGEVWRALTALTLHAGFGHVASNAVFCAIFTTAVCRALGPGVGVWLILLAGAAGNVLNALWRGAPHSAVGASTAIFGAVGILGGLQFMSRYRWAASRRRAWVPIAAALALLAMLGTGADTDVLAHLFGFIAGVALGVAVSLVLPQSPGRPAQTALSAAALAAVGLAWAMALR